MKTLPPPIARGNLAEIYDIGAGRVVKLFRLGCRCDQAERELAANRLAVQAGIPTPRALETVVFGERFGIVLERVEGPTMLQCLLETPRDLSQLASQFAEFHARIHAVAATGLPCQFEKLRSKIARADLSTASRTPILAAIDQMPAGSELCHGDFHPQNLLMTSAGPVVLDWLDATCGNKLADVARTCYLLLHAPVPASLAANASGQLAAVRQQFCEAYLYQYRQRTAFASELQAAWELPTLAARLGEAISPAERGPLHQRVEQLLASRDIAR